MHANDLIVNDSRARQAIKSVAELLPHFDRVAATTLIVKAVDSVDSSALVVSS